MRRVRSQVRRTGRGHLIKAVKEQYLREDVGCGVRGCSVCALVSSSGPSKKRRSGEAIAEEVLVVDPAVLSVQLDVLRHPRLPALAVPQSALSMCAAKLRTRIRTDLEIGADLRVEGPNASLLLNDLMASTYVERRPGESMLQRAVRAGMYAAHWLQGHLASQKVKVALLVDESDLEARSGLAAEWGVRLVTIQQLASAHPELEELLAVAPEAAESTTSTDADSAFLFDEFEQDAQVLEQGLREGRLHQGLLRVSMGNRHEGRVECEDLDHAVLVSGRHMNRAIDGDVVLVELLPESEWQAPSHRLNVEEVEEASLAPAPLLEDEADAALLMNTANTPLHRSNRKEDAKKGGGPSLAEDIRPSGRIVRVLERKQRPIPGTLQLSAAEFAQESMLEKGQRRTALFVPLDRRLPRIRIRTRQLERLVGQRILVGLDSWSRRSAYPDGHYVAIVGAIGDRMAESEAILRQYDIPFEPFSEAVRACLPAMPWAIDEAELEGRRDLRQGPDLICSIDPPGCTDIDDALSCTLLDNGHYRVGVHIADVAHFVRPGEAIDVEAAERGNTMYLVERRIDMLPGLLGENLCSLRPHVDRLAFSVQWELDAEARVVSVDFFRSAIRSQAALTYGEAQARVEDASAQDALTASIRQLLQLSKHLRERRMAQGALALESLEVRFERDAKGGEEATDVHVYEHKDTNRLVEEFMLLANISVAEKIRAHYPHFAMLRRHPTPAEKNFAPLLEAAAILGVPLRVGSSLELSRSLAEARERYDDPYFDKLIRIWTTRCMATAVYFASGSLPPADYHHYGLAAPIYTHFTSPIRRYADVVVHRQLAAALGLAPLPLSMDKMFVQRLCTTLNRRHKNAQYAGRASAELHTVAFFRNRVERHEAYVVKVKANGFSALVPRYGLEGSVRLPDLPLDSPPFVHDVLAHSLTRSKIRISLFMKVVLEISVDSSNHLRPVLMLKCVDPPLDSLP